MGNDTRLVLKIFHPRLGPGGSGLWGLRFISIIFHNELILTYNPDT